MKIAQFCLALLQKCDSDEIKSLIIFWTRKLIMMHSVGFHLYTWTYYYYINILLYFFGIEHSSKLHPMQIIRCKSKVKAAAFVPKKARTDSVKIGIALGNNSVEVGFPFLFNYPLKTFFEVRPIKSSNGQTSKDTKKIPQKK